MWGKRIATTVVVVTMAVAVGAAPAAWAGGVGDPMYGDLNADGLRDRASLGVVQPNRCVVKVELGKRGGGYKSPKTYTYLEDTGTDPISCPDLGVAVDLGGDGSTELVLAWFAGRPPTADHDLLVLRNYQPAAGFDAIHQPSYIGLADFNGDGRQDVYQWTDQGEGFVTYLNTSSGGLTPGPVRWCAGWPQFRLADFNGNGAMDVVISYVEGCGDAASGVVVIRDDGTKNHIRREVPGENYWSVETQDLNGDGRPDLIVTDNGSDEVRHYLGNGDATFTESPRAVRDKVSINGSRKTKIAVLDNDYATTQAKISVVTAPQHGTVRVTSDRKVLYTPSSGKATSDRFVYRLTEHGRTSNATVNVTVRP
ncbi:hypothetical protein GCM10027280_25540 [Micromonospora polyrhachis]|uniref:VCBS repeat-containing protein n=1 Tax=Micromonospora polyrhachis TaxID=1282883 RepID=A0A7W7SSW5_9ACTN|nr:FG-GAP-like repeat-containing protein [Micromonospora polyrhachis]MBB4960354.1 hypothetical protein [Micromonospora polyrhachis]